MHPLLVASVLCLVGGLPGQEVLWHKEGVADVLWVGGSSIFLGDVDGDGYEDLAHGATASLPSGQETQVLILSGRDGQTLRVHRPPLAHYGNISLTGAGDVDEDGIRDYAVTLFAFKAPFGPNLVEVRSGRDDNLIWQTSGPWLQEFGKYLAGNLDLDGDGKVDLLIGVPRELPNPAVHAYDNRGALLYKVPIPHWGLGVLGDLDGDGCDDFIVGTTDTAGRGAAEVRSGRNGAILVTGLGEVGDGLGSGHNAGCGDVDGDGVLDFVSSSNGGFGMPGVARVFSGQSGQQIYSWRHPVGSSFGAGLAVGDLDRDGVADLLLGVSGCVATASSTPAMEWRSLRDGRLTTQICRPSGQSIRSAFGLDASIGGAQPGHPFSVFVVSDHLYGSATVFPAVGRVSMFRAAPAGVSGLGPSCRGTLPTAPQLGLTARQTDTRLHLSQAPRGTLAFVLLGVSRTSWAGAPLPLPLEPLGFTGCSLYTSVELPLPMTTGTAGLNAGYAFVDLPVPVGNALGVTLHGQWLVAGSGATLPGALSNAISWRH